MLTLTAARRAPAAAETLYLRVRTGESDWVAIHRTIGGYPHATVTVQFGEEEPHEMEWRIGELLWMAVKLSGDYMSTTE